MDSPQVLAGPTLSLLEEHVFETVAGTVGSQPESVLYIGQQEHPRDATKERWKAHGSSGCLRVETFDNIVSDCYERDQFKGQVTHIDRPLLFRLVELGVEGVESPTNPFYANGEFPRAGLVDAAEDLYTNLEFAGLLSPETMRTRLVEEGLDRRASQVAELAEAVEAARQGMLADELPDTYRTERMHHVTTMERDLGELLPSVEAVVLGGFTRFDALERSLLTRIMETWPTIALFPKQTDSREVSGIDIGASAALETYLELGFSLEYLDETSLESNEARRRIAASLYQHPEQTPSTADVDSIALDLTYSEPETVPEEIRSVARDVRSQLGAGAQAENIGVVLTSPNEYADQVREIFETYRIPRALQLDLPLSDTALGEVVETICDLTREPRSVNTLLTLLTNPLVSVSNGDER
jgi:ATP-dependent nuclease, subunit B